MPTVPRYSRQVGPQPRPSGTLRAVETPTSAGVGAAQARAALGRGVADIGGAISDVGSKFLNITYSQRAKEMEEARDYANQLAVLGASNKLDTWERNAIHAPETGALAQHGEAAFHLPETVTADFKKTADAIEQSLYTPEQTLAFAKIRSNREQSVSLTVARHVDDEMQKFAARELDAKKDNTLDAAIVYGGAGDFKRSTDAMNEYAAAVETIGKRLGLPPEARAQAIRDQRSAAHVGIIEQLVADEHVDLAKRYYEVVTGRTIDGKAVGAPGAAPGEQGTQEYGLRPDGTKKGNGFLGPLQLPNNSVASEYSIADSENPKLKNCVRPDNPDGYCDYPTLVPTLTKAEVQQVLQAASTGGEVSQTIKDKAEAHALKRIADGKSPFAGAGEQSTQYPDLPRAGQTPVAGQAAPTQKRSEIEGQALDNITKLLKTGSAKKDAQDLRDQVQAEGGTEEEQRQKVKARSSGDVEDMALDYIEHDHAVAESVKRERSEAASTNMTNILEKTHGSLRAIQGLPEWTDLKREERSGLRSYAKALAEGVDPTTDWKAYYGARTLAVDDPEAFAALDIYKLYRGKTANAQFETLLDIRSAIRSKDATKIAKVLGGVSTDTQIWNSVVKAPGSGINEDTDAARALRTRWEQMVEAEQQARGKELDVTEKRQYLDDLVMDAAITKGTGWWPFSETFWDRNKKGYLVTIDDIPQSERQAIVDGLRAAKPPLPATDDNILKAYLQHKRKK